MVLMQGLMHGTKEFLTAAVKHKVLRRDTETKAPAGAEFRLVSGLVFIIICNLFTQSGMKQF